MSDTVAAGPFERPSPVMRAMAHRTAEAKASIPHFYLQRNVEMDMALRFRAARNDADPARAGSISLNHLVVRASALALMSHPAIRRSWTPRGFVSHEQVHIGIAVALDDGGLIVPVLRDVDRRPLPALASGATDIVRRARDRQLVPDEMGGATMTVSNLGMLGVAWFAAIINPPEACILAVGAVEPYVSLDNGSVTERYRMALTLSVDHRVCAGAEAARFLATIGALLEAPERLV